MTESEKFAIVFDNSKVINPMKSIHGNMNLILAYENGFKIERRRPVGLMRYIDLEPNWMSDAQFRLWLPSQLVRLHDDETPGRISSLLYADNIVMYELVNGEIVQYAGAFGQMINHPNFVGYTLGAVDLDWF
jgi:hypothetical protein